MKVETTHIIDATPTEVWAVLADVDRWSEWNPQMVEASGSLAVGEELDLTMVDPKGRRSRFSPVIGHAEPGRRLEWTGRLAGIPGLFTGRHWFELTELDGPTPRVQLDQGEDFSGVLVPVLRRMLAHLPETFGAVNRALGARVHERERCA